MRADLTAQARIEAVELEDTLTKERSRVSVGGLFIAIGHSPATKFLQGTGEGTMTYENQLKVYRENPVSEHLSEKEAEEEEEPAE